MSEYKATTFLLTPLQREQAKRRIDEAPDGYVQRIRPPSKSRDQEDKYHAMFGDIKKSGRFFFLGHNCWSEEDIKRLLVESFANEMAEQGNPLQQVGRIVPSLDMQRTVQLGVQTREFTKKEASNFIEYLYAYGASLGVVWSEPVARAA